MKKIVIAALLLSTPAMALDAKNEHRSQGHPICCDKPHKPYHPPIDIPHPNPIPVDPPKVIGWGNGIEHPPHRYHHWRHPRCACIGNIFILPIRPED